MKISDFYTKEMCEKTQVENWVNTDKDVVIEWTDLNGNRLNIYIGLYKESDGTLTLQTYVNDDLITCSQILL